MVAHTFAQSVRMNHLTNLAARCNVHLMLRLRGTTYQAQHEMQSALRRDLVIVECPMVFELLSLKDQAHHRSGNALFILYAAFDNQDGVIVMRT
jgi:hypothetical protein